MPGQLTTDQLEAIQRLIVEPLRQTVRAEVQTGHERLAAAITKVAEQLETQMADALRRDRQHDGRLENLEVRAAGFERFRARVIVVYGVLTFVLSLAWSMLRDWIEGIGHRK